MSWGDHDNDLINKRLGTEQRLREQENKKAEQKPQTEDESVRHDLMMLERMSEYDISEKTKKFIQHILSLPKEKAEPMLINFIQGRTGSALLHYENKFVRKIITKSFNEQFS